jgi:hypothetical protein
VRATWKEQQGRMGKLARWYGSQAKRIVITE